MVESTPVKISASPASAKVKAVKTKKPGSKPSHPPTSQLVNGAIMALKERTGSSLQAIKKYIATNNKVDVDKLSPFIRKYLKKATASGQLIQTKGNGASGSFKMSAASLKPKVEKKSKKKATVKKSIKPKTVAKTKKTVKSKAKIVLKQKSRKPSNTKPKAPKPKKAQPKKPVTATKKTTKSAAK